MTKNEAITAQVATLVASGLTPVDALKSVCGADMVDAMIDDLYTKLRAKAQLEDAIQQRDAARIQFNTATTRKARLAADEDLNFWIGKVAMLTAMVGKVAA